MKDYEMLREKKEVKKKNPISDVKSKAYNGIYREQDIFASLQNEEKKK